MAALVGSASNGGHATHPTDAAVAVFRRLRGGTTLVPRPTGVRVGAGPAADGYCPLKVSENPELRDLRPGGELSPNIPFLTQRNNG